MLPNITTNPLAMTAYNVTILVITFYRSVLINDYTLFIVLAFFTAVHYGKKMMANVRKMK